MHGHLVVQESDVVLGLRVDYLGEKAKGALKLVDHLSAVELGAHARRHLRIHDLSVYSSLSDAQVVARNNRFLWEKAYC